MARGHFIVRRLERSYGKKEVQQQFEQFWSILYISYDGNSSLFEYNESSMTDSNAVDIRMGSWFPISASSILLSEIVSVHGYQFTVHSFFNEMNFITI